MQIAIEIKANEKTCGKCRFFRTYRNPACGIFNESLKTYGKGYKRLNMCKDAEIKKEVE
jgi:hypothetical protein